MDQQKIAEAMDWRFAVQKFDTEKKLTDEQVASLMDVVRKAPSSFGVEPWHFVVVSNRDMLEKLKDAAFGQAKVAQASHLVVLAHKTDARVAIDDHVRAMSAANGGAPLEAFDGWKTAVGGAVSGRTEDETATWFSKQTYIALGVLIETAALTGIDAAPMEGFDAATFDQLLGLEEKGLHAASIVALGYRDGSDEAAARPKARQALADAVSYVR